MLLKSLYSLKDGIEGQDELSHETGCPIQEKRRRYQLSRTMHMNFSMMMEDKIQMYVSATGCPRK